MYSKILKERASSTPFNHLFFDKRKSLTLFNLVFLLVWNGETRHECPAPLRVLKAKKKKTWAFRTESKIQVVHIERHIGSMWRRERRKLTANGSSTASFDCIFIMNTGYIACSDCKCDVAVFVSLGDRIVRKMYHCQNIKIQIIQHR